ncbi:MAG: TIGR01212 family radical SAM protein [Clostridia bacterium]|nr:TIGR01212 family radical SAM protein [Clostridia bacterium]
MYRSLNQYLNEKFGCKVYKLALSGGMSCPNRDGTLSNEGCIFCSAKGSGDFAEQQSCSLFDQIEKAKSRVVKKIKTNKFIAYFQDYTNTYAEISYLEKIFTEAISHPDVVALSIATRPDCLPESVLNLLENLNKIKPVWVELGLQTVHESTAKLINRQYDLTVFDQAVINLKRRGIEVIAHMIIGLPFETEEMIYQTAKYIGESNVDGIKIHLLHVLNDTKLAQIYENGCLKLPTLEEYTNLLIGCLKRIPPHIVVHRLTGDGAKKELIAPLWSADKKRVLNYINSEFKKQKLKQGELFVEN